MKPDKRIYYSRFLDEKSFKKLFWSLYINLIVMIGCVYFFYTVNEIDLLESLFLSLWAISVFISTGYVHVVSNRRVMLIKLWLGITFINISSLSIFMILYWSLNVNPVISVLVAVINYLVASLYIYIWSTKFISMKGLRKHSQNKVDKNLQNIEPKDLQKNLQKELRLDLIIFIIMILCILFMCDDIEEFVETHVDFSVNTMFLCTYIGTLIGGVLITKAYFRDCKYKDLIYFEKVTLKFHDYS